MSFDASEMGESCEWVEIIEPNRREHMFANLKTGQCLWDPPEGATVKPTQDNQWWELFDENTKRYYYFNATTEKTVWGKPKDGDIVPLAKLQMLKAKEVRRISQNDTKLSKTSPQGPETIFMNSTESTSRIDSSDRCTHEVNVRNSLNKAEVDVEQDIVADDMLHQNYRTLVQEEEDPVYENYSALSKTVSEEKHDTSENMVDNEDDEAFYENVNFKPTDHIENSANPEYRKSATLPRTSNENAASKPKFNSFRTKAPPKPPRILSNSSFKLSVQKSPAKTKTHDEENKENESKNVDYTVTVQKSPMMNRRALAEKPKHDPPSPPKLQDFPTSQNTTTAENLELTTPDLSPGGEEPPMLSPYSKHPQPVSVPPVPPPPPPPPLALLVTSTNNDMRKNTASIYDNLSESDLDYSRQSNISNDSTWTRHTSASSDDSATPSGTLIRSETAPVGRSSYYERLNDDDVHEETPLSSPRKPPTTPESDRSVPVKRSPLTRMKSDSLDMEKRAKLAKSLDGANHFRPVSMMNLSSPSQVKAKRKASESDIPEQVPLSTHRRGLFRRRISIHSMLSWSKTPIKKPMVLTRSKQQRKDAVEIFKLLLQYMGDKSSRKNTDSLAVEITTRGWSNSSLRDEIYIQLCKQTTGNDKVTSLRKGWELITACLSLFPPSNKFHSYLEGYIYRNLEDGDGISEQAHVDAYAKHCYKQLERICQTGAKRGLKGPTLDEINAAVKRVFNPSMFGNSLEDIMELQAQRFPENRLPWILTSLTDAVLLQNGLQTEGIFRVPGDIDEVNSLKLHVDSWNLPERMVDPHVPASLLKLWFRDLYEPLIPQRFYDQCVHNCDNQEVCLNIVNSLPPINNIVFSYLIRLLQAFKIPENVVVSKMDENNLAMVWAPNCLRCPFEDPREIFENTRKEMTFLRTVMKCLDTSFLEGVV